VRWLLAYTGFIRAKLRQVDFVSAFLNSLMEPDQYYVEQVEGFEEGPFINGIWQLVCMLLKAIYGLKEAPQFWQEILHIYMLK
jgi:hypothetical protein